MRTFYISGDRKDELVVAYWLYEAVEAFERKEGATANLKLELAKRLLPGYFECYKVAAYLCGVTSIEKGKEEYLIAENCCEPQHKERMYIYYAAYLLRTNDYRGSLEKLQQAATFSQKVNNYIFFEQAKCYACMNNFSEAYKVLDCVDQSEASKKELNILYTRMADVKRRESENFKYDEFKKFELLKEAYGFLNNTKEADRGIYQYICVILKTLAYMYYVDEAMEFVCEILRNFYSKIRRESDFKRFKDTMSAHIEQVVRKDIRKEIQRYLLDDNERFSGLDENEGIVYNIDRDRQFAFFKNSENPQGVYFRIYPYLEKIQIGSVVVFDKIIVTSNGKRANRIISFS